MSVPLEKSFFNLEISFICAVNRIDPSVLNIGGKPKQKQLYLPDTFETLLRSILFL